MAHGFKPKGPNFNIPNSLAVTGKKSILNSLTTYGEITCSEIVLVNPSIITFDISISGSSSTGLVATVTTNYA